MMNKRSLKQRLSFMMALMLVLSMMVAGCGSSAPADTQGDVAGGQGTVSSKVEESSSAEEESESKEEQTTEEATDESVSEEVKESTDQKAEEPAESKTEESTDQKVEEPTESKTEEPADNTAESNKDGNEVNTPTQEVGPIEVVSEDELVALTQYESRGFAFGNTMPVKKDGLWGLIDFNGNLIVEPTYPGYWAAPNDGGYAVFNDGDYFYVVGQEGMVRKIQRTAKTVRIGDGNIISYNIEESEDYLDKNTTIYETIDGTEIYRVVDPMNGWMNAHVPFRDGKAYVFTCNESGSLVEIQADGTWKEIDKDYTITNNSSSNGNSNSGGMSYHSAPAPVAGNHGGYFVGTYPGGGGGYCLVNASTAECTNRWILAVNQKLVPEVSIDDCMNMYGSEDYYYEDYFTNKTRLQNYYVDGGYGLNYNTVGCLRLSSPEGNTKDILFDYNDVGELGLDKAIAIYDTIIFSDYKYLAVCEKNGGDSTWKFIDYTGNVVSKDYYDATEFTNDGYAIVMEEHGTAYLIDSNFNKLKEFQNVNSASLAGEAFVLNCYFIDNPDKQDGSYLYYVK